MERLRAASASAHLSRVLLKSVHTPRRSLWPVLQGLRGPSRSFVRVAHRAGIRNFIFVGHRWSDEGKRMRSNFDVRDSSLNFRHMAGNATTAGRAFLMMRVLFDGGGAWTVQGKRAVTIHANLVRWFSQLRIVVRSVHVVATKARDAATVHHALYEIIALHAVFVSGAIREMREGGLAQFVFFQLPKIAQV